jgi:DAACS family dicarboxylate/amino acid:cation (Na+ or H+) symporter
MLAVMVFSLLAGIGLTLTSTDAARRLLDVIEGLYDLTMTLIQLVIAVAPIGVAALLFTMTAQLGYSVLIQLARYVGVVLLGLTLHQVVVYSLSVRFLGGMSPLQFFRGISDAMLTAFSTSSSSATLPTALKVAEERLGLPPHISRFVLTVGSTANQNGTALFEGVTVLFLAQLYGVPLTLGSQALVVALCILGGIGTAGVPAGSLPVVALILGMVGVPVEGIGLVLGVDRFLDMCRTTLNVSGDLAAAVVVAHSESWTPAPALAADGPH